MKQTKTYRIYQVDSFTKEMFYGNPAGVVPDADGLVENEMLQIARELGNSETAFIFSSTSPEYDVHVRFFTPVKEVPLCGHATIAAHYIRALEKNLTSTTIIQKTGAGNLPVDITKKGDDYEITMTQGKIELSDPLMDKTRAQIICALDLNETDINQECPVQIVSTGHSKVLIGIMENRKLNALKPDFNELINISRDISCNGYFVFNLNTGHGDILSKGRMFAPAIGINEDPVTGNANGPLGAYLVYHKLVPHDGKRLYFTGMQGEAINRTGYVRVTVDIENDKPIKTKVGGQAVVVFKTDIKL